MQSTLFATLPARTVDGAEWYLEAESDFDYEQGMDRIFRQGDRLMRYLMMAHTILAGCLAPVYSTWWAVLGVAVPAVVMFAISSTLLPRSFITRCIACVSLQMFCALHIFQMHGMPEMHFFFFTATTAMIVYQDWRSLLPGVFLIIGQHILFAVLSNSGVNLYFFPDAYIAFAKLIFHFGIALVQVGICCYWAHLLHLRTVRDAEQQHRQRIDMEARRALEVQLLHSQKMESVGRLAGGVAHDFNNLLTAIIGYSDLALMRQPNCGELSRDIEQIQKAATRAAGLTSQLLSFARKQIIEPKVVNVGELARGLSEMLQRLIGEEIELVTASDHDSWSANIDPGQFEQILTNMAINARDAMPYGGTLSIRIQNEIVEDREMLGRLELVHGEYVLLTIADTGVGMSPSVMDRIFEPFFTTKDCGKGTGLGLATCYGVVRQAGGSIDVRSDLGNGTTFYIYLPRAAAEPISAQPARQSAIGVTSGNETILLVEDGPSLRRMASGALTRCGYQVLEAQNGLDALKVLESVNAPIDLLLTDVIMPRMGGKELSDRLTASGKVGRVLFMSGYTDDKLGDHGMLDPGVSLIRKPFKLAELTQRVREALDAAPAKHDNSSEVLQAA